MSTEERKSLACHHLQAAWMPCDLQPADANKKDIQYDHDPPRLEQVRRAICVACPDLTLTIEDVLAEGKQVATRWTLRGTDTRGYRGRLPTGRQITTTGIQMARFEQNRLVEVWEIADLLGILSQLGFLCTPEPPRITVRRFSS